jgi:hypothetical protein
VAQSEESPRLDLVYTPSQIHGVLFAERDLARRVAQIWRAVEESTTWGEFRAAMPATDWEHLVELWEGWYEDDIPIPPDDTPFTPDDVSWGDDGYYHISPWLPEVERKWFPEDLIDKYGGHVEWANANYDQLYLPGEAADEIAEELRARGHQVEKTFTGSDLNYWLEWFGDPPVSETSESTKSSSTRRPIALTSTEGRSKEQIQAAVWDLSGTNAQCASYRTGHQVHWIHFNHSMREPSPVIPVTALVDDDGLVHIEGDDLSLVLWNHRPVLLQAMLQRFGGMAVWKPRWHLLAVPTEAFIGSASSVFNMAALDERTACISARTDH